MCHLKHLDLLNEFRAALSQLATEMQAPPVEI